MPVRMGQSEAAGSVQLDQLGRYRGMGAHQVSGSDWEHAVDFEGAPGLATGSQQVGIRTAECRKALPLAALNALPRSVTDGATGLPTCRVLVWLSWAI